MNRPSVCDAQLILLADLIRRGAPALNSLILEPDGKYQTRHLQLQALMSDVVSVLAATFRNVAPQDFPVLYCAWGRARVGSTALANLFGMMGLPAYYQPVKAILRHVLTDDEPDRWTLRPASEEPVLFIKDVAGPYLIAECLYVPLELLVQAGYPADRLHLILLDRAPRPSLASWLTKWGDRLSRAALLRHFVLATLNAARVKAKAQQYGIPVTHYVYEASQNPVPAIEALFQRLGLADRFAAQGVTDWPRVRALDAEDSRVIFPREPDVYHVAGLHESEPGYRYRNHDSSAVTDEDLELLSYFGIPDLYRAMASRCAGDLGLPWIADEAGKALSSGFAPTPAFAAASLAS